MLLRILAISLLAKFATATDLEAQILAPAATDSQCAQCFGESCARGCENCCNNFKRRCENCCSTCKRGCSSLAQIVKATLTTNPEMFKRINGLATNVSTFAYVFTQMAQKLQEKNKNINPLVLKDGYFEMLAMGCFVLTILGGMVSKDGTEPKRILNPALEKRLLIMPFTKPLNFLGRAYDCMFHNFDVVDPITSSIILNVFFLLPAWNLMAYLIINGPNYAQDHAYVKLVSGLKNWTDAKENMAHQSWFPDFETVLETSPNIMKVFFPPYNGVMMGSPWDWFVNVFPTYEGLAQVFWIWVCIAFMSLGVAMLKPVKILLMQIHDHAHHHHDTKLGKVCVYLDNIYTKVVSENRTKCDFAKLAFVTISLLGLGKIKDHDFHIERPVLKNSIHLFSEIAKLGGVISVAYGISAAFKNRAIFPILLLLGSVAAVWMSAWRLIHEAIQDESKEWQGILEYFVFFGVYYLLATRGEPLFKDAVLTPANQDAATQTEAVHIADPILPIADL